MSRTALVIVYVWLAALSAAVAVLALRSPAAAPELPTHAKLETLEVGRIDVVEPDGKPRVIIANAKQFPGVIWKGKEYPGLREEKGGILFFNDEGTEAGGMIYASDPAKHKAGAVWTFDQHDQDQTLALMYDEDQGKRRVGLKVWDRPDASMEPALIANAEYQAAKTDADRARAMDKIKALMAGDKPAVRMFAGKRDDGTTGLWLYDKDSKPRLRVLVDASGVPSLELLDADGKVVARMPN